MAKNPPTDATKSWTGLNAEFPWSEIEALGEQLAQDNCRTIDLRAFADDLFQLTVTSSCFVPPPPAMEATAVEAAAAFKEVLKSYRTFRQAVRRAHSAYWIENEFLRQAVQRGPSPWIAKDLEAILHALDRIEDKLESHVVRKRPGPRSNWEWLIHVAFLGRAYHRATGRRATTVYQRGSGHRGGEFVDFVARVSDIIQAGYKRAGLGNRIEGAFRALRSEDQAEIGRQLNSPLT